MLWKQVGSEDNDLDLNESGSFRTWLRRPKQTPETTQKTLERKRKDEERRRQRENVSGLGVEFHIMSKL